MKHYIIDGNNLIGKITSIFKLQQKDKQGSREKLAYMIDNYFHDKNARVTIHFDGYKQLPIKLTNTKIIYSDSKTADEKIKNQIELSNNPKNINVVTSDSNLREFARVCSSTVIKSEEFIEIIQRKDTDDEKKIIEKMKDDVEEWKQLFDTDED
jgi:uncharacterized protein